MEQKIETDFMQTVLSMLKDCGLISIHEAKNCPPDLQFSRLLGDGSSREFYRISLRDQVLCLAVAPGVKKDEKLSEARSARLIGRHLHHVGVPVPGQYGYNGDHGIILFEDLGDTKLHDLVYQLKRENRFLEMEELRPWYWQVLENLAIMQVKAAVEFDPDWCWDTKYYDAQVMLEKESGYFLRSFLRDLLNYSPADGIKEEFVEISRICEEEPPLYFLHRDFQSRNIMIKENRVRFIDFQGGRLGPLQYDLASLIIDPYTSLSRDFQAELFDYYLGLIDKDIEIDRKRFESRYEFFALQRNLQILGAFSFLSMKREKIFFKQFIYPSLVMLNDRLSQPCFDDFPILRKSAASSISLLNRVQSLCK